MQPRLWVSNTVQTFKDATGFEGPLNVFLWLTDLVCACDTSERYSSNSQHVVGDGGEKKETKKKSERETKKDTKKDDKKESKKDTKDTKKDAHGKEETSDKEKDRYYYPCWQY